MSKAILVQIIGAPIACKEGVKDTWREIAEWAGGQLCQRFGESVEVQYFDLFDPACPSIPANARMAAAIADCDILLARGMGAGAYESIKQAGIRPILTDISSIDEAVQAVISGQITDHTERLH